MTEAFDFYMANIHMWVMMVCGVVFGFYFGMNIGGHYGHAVGFRRGKHHERFWAEWRRSSREDTP